MTLLTSSVVTTSAGDLIRFTTAIGPFAIGGVAIDPTVVLFGWRVNLDGEETVWTYGIDPEVVRDAMGVYHVDIDTTPYVGLGGVTITGEFIGEGVGQAVGWAKVDVSDVPIPFSEID